MFFSYFKLKFKTPVHFGADIPSLGLEKAEMACHADTFFSALYMEACRLYGEQAAYEMLYLPAREGNFLISDLMPYYEETLYVPRPLFPEAPGKSDIKNRKRMKKISWIPARSLDGYLDFIAGKREELPDDEGWRQELGAGELRVRVALNYQEKPQPYYIGTFSFYPQAGLYFILGADSEERARWLQELVGYLGYSGLGGKRTSGLGIFELEDDYYIMDEECCLTDCDRSLYRMLARDKAAYYMSLSVIYPAKDELAGFPLDKSFYRLVRREGFVQSTAYSDTCVKRKPLVMLGSGSVFPERLKGDIPDVSLKGRHPVYRYGKSLMLGVDFDVS